MAHAAVAILTQPVPTHAVRRLPAHPCVARWPRAARLADVVLPDRARALSTGLRTAYIATLRPDGRVSVVPVGVVRQDNLLKISTQTRS